MIKKISYYVEKFFSSITNKINSFICKQKIIDSNKLNLILYYVEKFFTSIAIKTNAFIHMHGIIDFNKLILISNSMSNLNIISYAIMWSIIFQFILSFFTYFHIITYLIIGMTVTCITSILFNTHHIFLYHLIRNATLSIKNPICFNYFILNILILFIPCLNISFIITNKIIKMIYINCNKK